MQALWEKIVDRAGSNFGLKVLALMIAVGLWLAGQRDIERAVEAPVEFRNIPAGLMVMDNRVDFVMLRLSGPRTLVSTLDANSLRFSLDLSAAKPGTGSFPLNSNAINIPRGVTVSRITPPVVNLRIEPVLRRALPVSVLFANKLPAAYKIATISVKPEKVWVQGPADDVRSLAVAESLPVELEPAPGVYSRKVRLAADGKPLEFAPDQVEVTVTVEAARLVKEFGGVELAVKNSGGEYKLNPRSVYLRLAGPGDVMEKLAIDGDRVFLDLGGLTAGEHSVPLSFDLPPGVEVLEQKPDRFKVRIAKPKTG